MIDTLMIDREQKYNQMFRTDLLSNQDLNTDEEGPKILNENELTGKKVRNANLALADYDSDDERENANIMFISDLQCLRKYFIKIIS